MGRKAQNISLIAIFAFAKPDTPRTARDAPGDPTGQRLFLSFWSLAVARILAPRLFAPGRLLVGTGQLSNGRNISFTVARTARLL